MSSIFDAFILIGGISSRFGSNKAFAAFDGKTLASRAAEMVERTASPKTVRFVVRSEEQFDAERLLSLGRGVVDLRDAAYFASFIAFFLYLNVESVENRRCR